MTKEKIILDVDPGIDDSLAILLAIQSDQFDILGLTIGSGNVDSEQGAKNAAHVLDLLGRPDIPIYKGPVRPLEIDYTDARDTHGEDGLGETVFAQTDRSEDTPAAVFIQETLEAHPDEVTIFALGPLTNLATVLQTDPEGLTKAKAIRVMGGSYGVHGNCSPVAEYNFWCDPHAANQFFASKALPTVYLYTLDVTYDILFTPNMREMVKQFATPLGDFVWDITQFYVDFHWKQERTLGCIINDPLVVADAFSPMVSFYKGNVAVVETGMARGESVIERTRAGTVFISESVDQHTFFDVFLTTIFAEHAPDIKLMRRKDMI